MKKKRKRVFQKDLNTLKSINKVNKKYLKSI